MMPYAIGLTASFFILGREATYPALLILGTGDSCARLVGKALGWGRLGNGKTLAGLLGFVVGGSLMLTVTYNLDALLEPYYTDFGLVLMAHLGALVVAGLVELREDLVPRLPLRLHDDNFTVIASAALVVAAIIQEKRRFWEESGVRVYMDSLQVVVDS